MAAKRPNISIIVPVYGDWPSLSECIDSLIMYTEPKKHRVLLVNDCGPEADKIEAKILEKISEKSNFGYHRNKRNLGFLKNCNNAVMKLDATSNDVLLLNSDAKLTAGAIEAMQEVLHEKGAKIGAVSPRSNNATICTVPINSINQKGIGAEASWRFYLRNRHKFPRFVITPTAHGFCMLIRRDLIKKYGLFDEVFGKGYGEEVDFCQRIRAHNYQCALANYAYVYHQEARSFSLDTKAKLLETNNKIIRTRYPNYQQEVREYIMKAQASEPTSIYHKLKAKFKKILK